MKNPRGVVSFEFLIINLYMEAYFRAEITGPVDKFFSFSSAIQAFLLPLWPRGQNLEICALSPCLSIILNSVAEVQHREPKPDLMEVGGLSATAL